MLLIAQSYPAECLMSSTAGSCAGSELAGDLFGVGDVCPQACSIGLFKLFRLHRLEKLCVQLWRPTWGIGFGGEVLCLPRFVLPLFCLLFATPLRSLCQGIPLHALLIPLSLSVPTCALPTVRSPTTALMGQRRLPCWHCSFYEWSKHTLQDTFVTHTTSDMVAEPALRQPSTRPQHRPSPSILCVYMEIDVDVHMHESNILSHTQ